MNESMTRLEELFHRALQLRDPRQREDFLVRECGGDANLRRELDKMLTAHVEAGGFMEPPTLTITTPTPGRTAGGIAEVPGTRIGPYTLLEQLGEGGMGTVYLADQSEPVKRKVALKIIKPGMDSMAVVARFEQERQALAVMDHPNIARVIDGGTTDSGRPFFVMELVRGMTITQYCDDKKLSLRDRLELFIPVCQAVQHAHQKGIIHRDLKPSNVLIALYDGKPVPKVIDFGVAKATGASLTDATLHTQVGQMVGTLEYMAPEQAQPTNLDIDTRADIYSLGVILYELMTGTRPFSGKDLLKAGYEQMLRMIREVDPPKPSTRLSGSDSLPSVAALRGVEPSRLTRVLSSEPDWIVMKCLEKERARRYETANALAADIGRYLNDEPVVAGPPSRVYKLKRYARKYRGPISAACALAAILLLATGVSISLAAWALDEEEKANRSALAEKDAREKETEQRKLAEANEAKAVVSEQDTRDVMSFFEDNILAAGGPEGEEGGLGKDVTLRTVVDAAVPKLAGAFQGRAMVEGSIRTTLGRAYHNLGDYDLSLGQYELALGLYNSDLGPNHPNTLSSLSSVADNLRHLGRHAESLAINEETYRRTKERFGPVDPDTLASMHNLANSYAALGRYADALKLREETLRLSKAELGPEHPDTLSCMHNLARSYDDLGRYDEALKLREETLRLRRSQLGPGHLDTLDSMNELSNSYATQGRHAEALSLREETLQQRKSLLGPDHPKTLSSMQNLSNIYAALGRHAEALELSEKTLQLRKAKLGPYHPDTLMSMHNLANSYRDLGRYAEALKLREETLGIQKAKLGPDHPDTLLSMWGLAETLVYMGRGDDAVPIIDEGLRSATDERVHPQFVPGVMDMRLRIFQQKKDASGCVETAAMWESLQRNDPGSVYSAACYRAVSAGLLEGAPAVEQEDLAMGWLRKAVDAGWNTPERVAHMKQDADLDALRGREDFQALLAELEAKQLDPAKTPAEVAP